MGIGLNLILKNAQHAARIAITAKPVRSMSIISCFVVKAIICRINRQSDVYKFF